MLKKKGLKPIRRKKQKENIVFNVSKEELLELKNSSSQVNSTLDLAERHERFLATLIDLSPIMLAWLLMLIFSSFEKLFSSIFVVLLHGIGLFNLILLANRGQTIGKYFRRICIIDSKTGDLDWAKIIFLRPLPFYILYAFFLISIISSEPIYALIPFLLIIIDSIFVFRKDRRCIHDLIAGTKVVNIKNYR